MLIRTRAPGCTGARSDIHWNKGGEGEAASPRGETQSRTQTPGFQKALIMGNMQRLTNYSGSESALVNEMLTVQVC